MTKAEKQRVYDLTLFGMEGSGGFPAIHGYSPGESEVVLMDRLREIRGIMEAELQSARSKKAV